MYSIMANPTVTYDAWADLRILRGGGGGLRQEIFEGEFRASPWELKKIL